MKEFIIKYYVQLGVIIAIFCLIVFIIMQLQNAMVMIGERSVELKKNQLDRVLSAEFLQNIHIFKKDAEYIDENIATFNVLLPDADDAKVQLFSDIENMAKDTGHSSVTLEVNVENAKDAAKKKTNKDVKAEKSLSMNVSLVGSYNDLLYFVQKLENMQYFSNITSFDIVQTSSEKKRGDDEDVVGRVDLVKTDMVINFYLEDNGEESNNE